MKIEIEPVVKVKPFEAFTLKVTVESWEEIRALEKELLNAFHRALGNDTPVISELHDVIATESERQQSSTPITLKDLEDLEEEEEENVNRRPAKQTNHSKKRPTQAKDEENE